jgi:cytosine/adenosine deaminase-related metal-dependent hydrolase
MSRQTLYRARNVLPIISPLIEDGAVLVDSGLIRTVGHYRDLAETHPHVDLVDFGESTLLPPMVNAHTHLELTAFPDWAAAAGEPEAPQFFVDWVLWLVRIRKEVGEDQLKASLEAGLKASLLAGTGAVGDIFTTLEVVEAYLGSPLYGQVFAEVLGHDLALVEKRLSSIRSLTVNSPAKRLNWGLSPHAPYTLSASATDQVLAFAKEHRLQCAIHLAESESEREFLLDGTGAIADKLFSSAKWDPGLSPPAGCSPVRSLCREERLKEGDMVVHGVHVDTADIELLKQRGCSVVLCPRSNASLKVGKAPLIDYLSAGIPLALGTDSLASSDSLSVWDEMAFAVQWFAGAAAPRDWLEIATLGGAKALGIEKRVGQLAPGREASFQVVKLPALPQGDTLEEALCTAGKDINVSHLYLAGENVLL